MLILLAVFCFVFIPLIAYLTVMWLFSVNKTKWIFPVVALALLCVDVMAKLIFHP